MRQRMLALFGVAALVGLSGAACAQAEGEAGKTASPGRDLSGMWEPKYQIPLERSARDAGKTMLTEEEVAQREADRSKPRPAAPQRQNPNAKRGTYDDLIGAYDEVAFQGGGGERKPIGRQTSLIVDPPDGKIPESTAMVKQRTAEVRQFQLDI